jgi:2-C-methyl-D-erythritol 4-phosphate cytidylyltransferase
MNIAIILAGGKGVRLKQKKNKALVLLNKKEMIYYSLKTFQAHKQIDEIVVVAAKKDIKAIQTFLDKHKFSKVVAIVKGGTERQDSAFNGLKFIKRFNPPSPPCQGGNDDGNVAPLIGGVGGVKDIVLFHNVANPFVSAKEISQLITAARKYGAAVVGMPVKDTIKQVDKNQIIKKTLPRQNLWAVQTPQAIKFSLAWQAFNKAQADKFLGTDDVFLVERLGRKVKIIPGNEENFKITTPVDLKKAELILN